MDIQKFKTLPIEEQEKVISEIRDKKFKNLQMILHRNIEDVKIQTKTHKYLKKEREALKDRLNIDIELAYETEWNYRLECTEQELKGVLLDTDHIKKCIGQLDILTEELRQEIEPQLPPTLKIKSTRVSLSEISEILKLKRKLVDKYETVTIKGEDVTKVVKPYFKPTTNWLSVDKTNQYSGCHKDYGKTPVFEKKKECSDWIKATFPSTKTKEWDIQKTVVETSRLNNHTAKHFDLDEYETGAIGGPFTKIEWLPTKLSQHEQVKNYLLKLGWKPDDWNLKKDPMTGKVMRDPVTREVIKTTPKLTESSFESLPEGLGRKIADYNTYKHRRKFLQNEDDETKGLLGNIRDDGRLSCGVNNFGAASSRATHYGWVNAPGDGSLFGKEVRQCIVAPEGRVLVGADMKSAQLAIAAYYAKNSNYYDAVASGQEVIKLDSGVEKYIGESAHCFSARAFGIVSDREWSNAVETQDKELIHEISLKRKKSKAASFGVIFGCSGKKLAGMLNVPENEGEHKKKAFLSQMGLDGVQKWLKTSKQRFSRADGIYIPLPFGYWVWCKSEHAMINYLIQGTEAVCQRIAVLYFREQLLKKGLDAQKVLDYHDEFLVECEESIADEVGTLMCKAYTYASDMCYKWHLDNPDLFPNKGTPKFAFDLNGGYKVGHNYYDVH